ncbi:M20/M25/M40 family metallo-hydrolase [Deinococcus lacus]|uniref:M20/M25/M40 family metallo-hydrolase n=1 Tax=Deinococcus lacus TaxID=392561 RepID=A0ABW1YE69_9DEIO
MTWYEPTSEWLLRLVGWPSVTGSPGERDFAQQLEAALRRWPYFAQHPEAVWRVPALGGGPESLLVWVPGTGTQAVLLAGHFDTVGLGSYGPYQGQALDPAALRERLLASPELPAQARQDLQSGVFWPGRGMLDMKAGLAAALSVLERWVQQPRQGHLLLAFSPDEEELSRGIRTARRELARLTAPQGGGLDLVAALNLDATSDQGDGQAGRAVYLGTVGKVMPCVYMVGRPTHAGYPFEGLSAHLLAASVLRRLENRAELADAAHGEAAPPPPAWKAGISARPMTSPRPARSGRPITC